MPSPSLEAIAKHGKDPSTLAVFFGLILALTGLAGDLAISNKKLMAGSCLIFVGLAWVQAREIRQLHPHDGIYTSKWHLAGFLLLAGIALVLAYCFITGHLPN